MAPGTTEIGFYHLTRSTAEQALPRLLGRTLDLGKRALVRVRDEARVAALDEALWRAPEPAWLPHGTARLGHPELQPVWIEAAPTRETQSGDAQPGDAQPGDAQPAPNGASFLFLLDGVEAAVEPFERVFDLFDGGDEAAVAAARVRWAGLREAGHRPAYWRQDAQGWQKAG